MVHRARGACNVAQVNELRNAHHISVYGSDVPGPVEEFERLRTAYRVHARVLENVLAAGFVRPTAIEMQAMPVMLEVCDVIIIHHSHHYYYQCKRLILVLMLC